MEARAQELFQASVLGPLRVWHQETELSLGSPQQRTVLALLLLRRGRAVAIGELVDGIWGASPPAAAVSVLRTYVSRLRKLLEPNRPVDRSPQLLVSLGDGYALRPGAVLSDLDRFDDLVTQAGALRAEGNDQAAVQLLRRAIELWQGVPLAGLPGPRVEAERRHLEERRLSTLEMQLRIELDLGQHCRALPELTVLCEAYPLREALCELHMVALYRSGRWAEALDVYARTRRALVEELGIEPGPSLRALHDSLLAESPGLARPVPQHTSADAGHAAGTGHGQDGPGASASTVRPSQLPADLATFAGRQAELDCVTWLLPDRGRPQSTRLGLISGMAGAGKTTLVVHWAHQIAHFFPDGSLYVNLRGHGPSGSRMDPREALERFLVALGVAPQAVPEGVDAQAALYRGVLADRRVLIVLDNAGDTEQVEPLLPASPGCFVVVTSRSRLSGLVARHGAHPLTLGGLSDGESLELLAGRLGQVRVDAEPEAARDIVDLCARLPLALSIIAARAALHLGFRLTDIAAELRQDHGSLEAFSAGGDFGTDMRAIFSWSYRALSPQAARLFRLLTLHPGPDITRPAAAALAGEPPHRVRVLLTELTGASLLIERAPSRFVFHDLLRAYATERTEAEDSEPVRRAALLRLYSHFLLTAHHVATVLDPFRETMQLPRTPADAAPLRFTDRAQAAAWLRTERYVLREIVGHAAAHGFDTHAWLTAAALNVNFNRLGYWQDLLEINGTALRSAQAAGSITGQAYSLCGLGGARSQLNHVEQALQHFQGALELFRSADHAMGQALTHRGLAYLSNRTNQPQAALDHYAQAIRLYRSEDNVSGEAGVLNQVAWTYILIGEHEKALEHCDEAILHCQQLGDPYGEASTQDTLGYALYHLARYPEAIERFERSRRLFQEIGDRYLESEVLRHLGDAHLATGDRKAACAALTAALALLDEGGHAEADVVRRTLQELHESDAGVLPA
ncbi:BTAD domain-containing putative transcriptional regulator [Streptomyces flaveolus]|uniref:AfsR/SARP family transcriptional regulator n=1 Tax=Streptomyces flaveolus TaxID=67297 RepID=UPI00343FDEED